MIKTKQQEDAPPSKRQKNKWKRATWVLHFSPMAAPPPPPSGHGPPPPPGCWKCPKCDLQMASSASPGTTQRCLINFSWKHRVCDSCFFAEMNRALEETKPQGMVASPRIPGVAHCLFPECNEVWSYNDWMTCRNFAVAAYVQTAYLNHYAETTPDISTCPACGTIGVLPERVCRDVICALQTCGFQWCSECNLAKHPGMTCEKAAVPVLSDKPDKFISLNLPTLAYSGCVPHVNRSDITLADGVAFTLDNILEKQECETIIQAAEAAKFESLEKLFPNDYRSNDRLLVRSERFADLLFDRICFSFQPSDLRQTPMGPSGSGMWLPYAMNDVIKIGRYNQGCYFKAHRDGPWAPSLDHMSIFTFVLYLNTSVEAWKEKPHVRGWTNTLPRRAFHGGNTRFISAQDPTKVLASVYPVAGTALLFSQHLPHEGAAIQSGRKYILRTEVLFRRVQSVLDPSPAFLAANEDLKKIAAAYKASCEAMDDGEKEKFLSEYLKAIEIQAKPQQQSQKLPFPDDVTLSILAYLSDRQVLVKFGRLNKTCYRLSRDNAFWRERLHKNYPETASVGPQDLSVNWLQRYKGEVEKNKRVQSQQVIIDFGNSIIKVARRNAAEKCVVHSCTSFYKKHEDIWYSHGSRNVTVTYSAAEWTAVRVDLMKGTMPAFEAACSSLTSSPTPIGMQFLAESPVLKKNGLDKYSSRGIDCLYIVPDLWTEKILLGYLQGTTWTRELLPRFITSSLAVLKLYQSSNAIVFSLGFSFHTLTLVQDNTIVRVVRLQNFTPGAWTAPIIASLIHSMLQNSEPTHYAAETAMLTALRESAKKSLIAKQFADQAQAKIEERQRYNRLDCETLRQSVKYEVVVTGGYLLHPAWQKWMYELKSALRKHSTQWKVKQTKHPNEDAVRGAWLVTFSSPEVFRYGSEMPITAKEVYVSKLP